MFTPPYTHPLGLGDALRQQGFALLPPQDVAALSGCELDHLQALNASWSRLGADRYLKDGGKYRFRRHESCVVHGSVVERMPHRAHWQPVEYNALHGGMERWFEPLEDATVSHALRSVLVWLASLCDQLKGPQAWFTEIHQFRIDTAGGIGRPTPEGAHRDGVDMVAVFLISRVNIKGGETRIFDANGPSGQRFTLTQPWSVLLLDDPRMIHETTPIQPIGSSGYRDTLVVTMRAGGFPRAA